jgi:predicted nucleic acid-binding protein
VIILDASILIAHLDPKDAHHARASEAMLAVADEPLGASLVTLAEVLVGPACVGRTDAALHALDAIGVTAVPMPMDSPVQLARLRAETRLPLPDCCVLLAAHTAGAPIATFDDRLARAAGTAGLVVVP